MNHDPYKALYLHIPFCVSRCAYCDFATQAIDSNDSRIDEYVENLVMEIRKYAKQGELSDLESIYIGGGTPTHIGNARLSSLLYAISLSVAMDKPGFEFTIEANPESLDERMVKDIWALGVNRLSIGVQSFDDAILEKLGRAHNAERAREAVRSAKTRFENVSVDLMCGIPGQTEEMLKKSINEAISLGVTHISMYPLTIEPHTPLRNQVIAGLFEEPDEDEQARHMEIARDMLEAAGFKRYEVANYAKPGYESRHNKAYWTGKPYIGIGLSAATMTQNSERRMRMQDGMVTDDLDRKQMEAEDVMMGMRLTCGVSDERISQAAQYLPTLLETLQNLEELGLVQHKEGTWAPTEQGWLQGNVLYEAIFELAP